jgi:porphobilinogen synthase
MMRETQLTTNDFILPLFVCEGEKQRIPIQSMPGHSRISLDQLPKEIDEVSRLGIPAVILFGVPDHKDSEGGGAWDENGIVQRAIRTIKNHHQEILVIADTCLCQYTDTGHCGVIKNQRIDNDASLSILSRTALTQAAAGADMIAPSDMMDGRIKMIRHTLDENGFHQLPIMAYAAKYASAFYGPFREAAQGTPKFGDRKSHQMDIANVREALHEIALDLEEGADIIMVKPALPYLDVISRARQQFHVPIAAYNVSGEFAMVKAAAEKGWIDGEKVMIECLTAIKRAGADMILTYFAKEAAALLKR